VLGYQASDYLASLISEKAVYPMNKVDLSGTFNDTDMDEEEFAPSLGALLDALAAKGIREINLNGNWLNLSCANII